MTSTRTRVAIVAAVAAGLAVAAGGYIWLAAEPQRPPAPESTGSVRGDERLQVLSNGLLSAVSNTDPGGPREVTEEQCDRAYARAGTVACLRPVDPLKATELVVFSGSTAKLRERRTLDVTGFPNRMRISPSGRMVGWTLFVDGHSYAANGFSTSTGILDTRTGKAVRNLEDFSITRDGKPYQAVDVNFWGMTFVDDNRFYATMSTDGHRYLVEGDFAGRSVRTVADGVECPSLSPDGKRIVFKSAVDGDPDNGWRLAVMDLDTQRITTLAKTRSVDDQAEWLDDSTVAYALQRSDGTNNVWAVPADGSGKPRLLVPEANSPARVTPAE